jgi:hypothetical protein
VCSSFSPVLETEIVEGCAWPDSPEQAQRQGFAKEEKKQAE